MRGLIVNVGDLVVGVVDLSIGLYTAGSDYLLHLPFSHILIRFGRISLDGLEMDDVPLVVESLQDKTEAKSIETKIINCLFILFINIYSFCLNSFEFMFKFY